MRATRLHDLAATLSRAETEADISDAIVHQASHALEAETAVLYLARPEGQLQLRHRAVSRKGR